jgi:hypothetical protein
MKFPYILLVVLGLVLCALTAGCTGPTEAEIKIPVIPTPSPIIPAPVSSSVSTVVATPVAVDTLPTDQYIDLQLTKERPDASIHLLYNGGPGELFVQNILMKVTRSDGQVIEQYMNDGNRRPRRGDELMIPGTRGNDRVEVFVTSSGRTYKVMDKGIISVSAY